MSDRRIIVNADDLGLSPGVNSAIFEVFRAGNLGSATLMVNMPGTQDAVDRLKDHPRLAVGLHFCITEGRALSGTSSLTGPEAGFLDRSTLVRKAFTGRIDEDDVRAELTAQLQRIRSLGVSPTHIDSHQHVLMVPRIFDAALPVLQREQLPVRMVDPPRGSVTAALGRPRKAMKQWINQRFSARDRSRLAGSTNDALVSIHDLESSGPYDATTYHALLSGIPEKDVVEVMVHPYILAPDVLELYAEDIDRKMPFLERCAAEYEALRQAPVFDGFQQINYGRL